MYQVQSKNSTEVDGSSGGNATMDSFMKRSGIKVSEEIRKNIREHTSILVTLAHLTYHFVEQDVLKEITQAFVNLGAFYGWVPAEQFIVGCLTVCKDIISKLNIAIINMPSSGFAFDNSIGDQLTNRHIQEILPYWV